MASLAQASFSRAPGPLASPSSLGRAAGFRGDGNPFRWGMMRSAATHTRSADDNLFRCKLTLVPGELTRVPKALSCIPKEHKCAPTELGRVPTEFGRVPTELTRVREASHAYRQSSHAFRRHWHAFRGSSQRSERTHMRSEEAHVRADRTHTCVDELTRVPTTPHFAPGARQTVPTTKLRHRGDAWPCSSTAHAYR